MNVTLIDFKTEDKENKVDGSYKRRRTEDEDHEDLEHPNSENFLNNEKNTDNDELEKHAEETIQYGGKIWIVGNTKINVRDALTKWQKRKDKPRTE